MDYKKKYKNALPYIKDLIEHNVISTESAGKYFPELKESEDEKIRKTLICFLKSEVVQCEARDKYIAWLEKQGEKIIPKNVDEAALQYVDTCPVNGEITHDNITEPYWNNHSMINAYKAGWLKKQGEQKQDPCEHCDDRRLNCHNFPCTKKKAFEQGKTILEAIKEEKVDNANKVEQKFKDGDVLNSPSHHLVWIYKDNDHHHACINMNYAKYVNIDGLISIPKDACPATKEQRKQLEKAMAVAGFTFDFEKKELKKIVTPKFKIGDTMRTLQEVSNGITSGLPIVVSIDNEYYHCNNELIAIKDQDNYEYPPMNRRQNPAWSEEDEKYLSDIIKDLVHPWNEYIPDRIEDEIKWLKNRLKSIKPQNTWKPSDEQIKAVRLARSFVTDDFGENHTLSDVLVELEKQLKKLK